MTKDGSYKHEVRQPNSPVFSCRTAKDEMVGLNILLKDLKIVELNIQRKCRVAVVRVKLLDPFILGTQQV